MIHALALIIELFDTQSREVLASLMLSDFFVWRMKYIKELNFHWCKSREIGRGVLIEHFCILAIGLELAWTNCVRKICQNMNL